MNFAPPRCAGPVAPLPSMCIAQELGFVRIVTKCLSANKQQDESIRSHSLTWLWQGKPISISFNSFPHTHWHIRRVDAEKKRSTQQANWGREIEHKEGNQSKGSSSWQGLAVLAGLGKPENKMLWSEGWSKPVNKIISRKLVKASK
jgi:hypothetical protein